MKLEKWATFSLKHWRWLLPAGIGASLVGVFLKLTEQLLGGEFEAADQFVRSLAISLRHASTNAVVMDLSALGSGTVLTIFSLFTLLVFVLMGDRKGAFALFFGACGAVFWTVTLKKLIARPRPATERLVEVGGHSFPSGHSLGAAAIYFLVAFLVIRHFRTTAARVLLLAATTLLVTLIGLSRLYLGVHYFSDVMSGLSFGLGWACLVTAAFFVLHRRGHHAK